MIEFKRKTLLALALLGSALYWSWVIIYLLTSTINLHSIDSAKELSGKLSIMPSFTRGVGSWSRLFVDEVEVVCTPVGYNRCDVGRQFSAFAGQPIIAKYIEYQPKPNQAVNLVVELHSGNQTILTTEAQLVQFQSFNERSQVTNRIVFASTLLAYVATILFLIRKCGLLRI